MLLLDCRDPPTLMPLKIVPTGPPIPAALPMAPRFTEAPRPVPVVFVWVVTEGSYYGV